MSVIAGNAPADSATLPPQPVVPSNPVETGLPQRSESITFNGALLNYLPVALTCVSVSCKIDITINSPVVGIMDPQGVQHGSGTFSAQWGELLFTLMIDPKSTLANSFLLVGNGLLATAIPGHRAAEPGVYDLPLGDEWAERDEYHYLQLH